MFLVKLKKDMMRISPYIIADLMSLFAEGVVPSYAKVLDYFLASKRQN